MNSPYKILYSPESGGGGSVEPPGESTIIELILNLPAGEAISALRAVWSDGSSIFYASASNELQAQRLCGLSVTAGGPGDPIQVKSVGLVTDVAWTWTPGFVWLGENGYLTQTPNPANANLVVGSALNANTLLLLFHEPIFSE